jgi:hypothetical protein
MSPALLTFIAALVATVTLTATPALASSNPSSGTTAQALSSCPWNGGVYICEYGVTGPYVFPSGQEEYWVIGTDNAVWTYYDDVNGFWHWTSLGGYATSSVDDITGGWAVILKVWGRGHTATYCKTRGDTQYSGWTGWLAC